MKKKGKKYIIKESELKEIILEALLMEKYNRNDYRYMYADPKAADKDPHTFGDSYKNAGKVFRGLGDMIKRGFENTNWGKNLQNKAYNGNDFLQWLLGDLGLQRAGSAGADLVPDFGQWGGKTQNGDAHEVLNAREACNFLRATANPNPTRWCARHVRMALNHGGLGLPNGMPAPSAKYYLNILPRNGWQEIPANQAGQPCDVIVIDAHNGHPDGHIAMCVGGGQWISDFVQATAHGLRVPPPAGVCHFFRYRNIQ